MRVLIVNTSEKTGGAAVAANRLKDALNNNGVKAKMLVRDKLTDDITVVSLGHEWQNQWHLLWERFCVFWHLRLSRNHLFEIDLANSGTDITRLREFREADVIHLSWINQGMLSLGSIRKILRSGKPVVWTMHDLWPASGICHYAHGCYRYENGCGNCPLLPGGGSGNDLSAKVWRRKRNVLEHNSVWFVTCSQWLCRQAKRSGLLRGQSVVSIPNPIDTHFFQPQDKKVARQRLQLPADRRVILFVSQRVTDRRKGMDYFVEAVARLTEDHPEMRENTGIAILGGHAEELEGKLALPVYPLGYVSDQHQIRDVYNAADVFVLPSLEDNLPNTIMEAMACGVPCVSFKVGGIPEMIDHRKNGYVAAERDAADLAEGMRWVLDEADREMLSEAAVGKVLHSYSQRSVALQYINVYNEAMAFKNYQI
ncbi:MAG: glycosyltransferase family 4 protein [Prevotella sp.]|nr:glycosyltransferase family 4 protein [Prevotella sp.]